ncbi:MAG: purine-nucleoside phosphorylase [Lentisphaerae bacterium]|nr:purine-nucleoside phosphorylase [Lentisphaerota bacterium]
MNMSMLNKAAAVLRKRLPSAKPVCGLSLGSGWGPAVGGFAVRKAIAFSDIPGLGNTLVAGHSGRILWAEYAGMETLVFQGRRHWYEGAGWEPVALPIVLSKALGVKFMVLTNAAGGIRADLNVGDVMIIDDHINALPSHPLCGNRDPFWGPMFVDQTEVYAPALRKRMDRAARQAGIPCAHGVYLATGGPTFETPAEIRAFRAWGADAVGMSTVPEAVLANAAGLQVLGLSCISNRAAGLGKIRLSHEDVERAAQKALPRLKRLLEYFWKGLRIAR